MSISVLYTPHVPIPMKRTIFIYFIQHEMYSTKHGSSSEQQTATPRDQWTFPASHPPIPFNIVKVHWVGQIQRRTFQQNIYLLYTRELSFYNHINKIPLDIVRWYGIPGKMMDMMKARITIPRPVWKLKMDRSTFLICSQELDKAVFYHPSCSDCHGLDHEKITVWTIMGYLLVEQHSLNRSKFAVFPQLQICQLTSNHQQGQHHHSWCEILPFLQQPHLRSPFGFRPGHSTLDMLPPWCSTNTWNMSFNADKSHILTLDLSPKGSSDKPPHLFSVTRKLKLMI